MWVYLALRDTSCQFFVAISVRMEYAGIYLRTVRTYNSKYHDDGGVMAAIGSRYIHTYTYIHIACSK